MMKVFQGKKTDGRVRIVAGPVALLLAGLVPAAVGTPPATAQVNIAPGYGGYGGGYGGGGRRGRRGRNGQTAQNGRYGRQGQNGGYGQIGQATLPAPKPFRYVPGGNINPAPVTDGSHVYVGTGSRAVYALDRQTGRRLWTFRPSGDVTATPAVGPDGTVYVTSYDHYVYALNGASGAKKWQFQTGDLVSTTPAVGANGLVYVGGFDHNLYALNASGAGQGRPKWTLHTGSAVAGAVLGPDGTVYVGADRVYALNGDTGRQKWAFSDGFVGNDVPTLDPQTGIVYVGAHDGTLYALSAATGAKKWQLATGSSIESAPALGPAGTLYVGADQLYALSARTGKVRWSLDLGAGGWSGPAVGPDGTVYAGCGDGTVYAVNAGTGRVRWTFPVADGLASAPSVGPDGSVFLTSSTVGRVYALAARSGGVFWHFDPRPATTASARQ